MTTRKHSKFAASSSHRWIECPGSVQLSEKAPPQVESDYANEGTRAHEVLEILLKEFGKHPYRKAQELSANPQYGEEMVKHAMFAFMQVEGLFAHGMELLSDIRTDLKFINEEMFGTLDVALVEEFGVLTVIDFKYGQGVEVEAKDNSQLVYYALGLAHKYNYNFSHIRLMIIQPRIEKQISCWEISIDELKMWIGKFSKAVKASEKSKPDLNPGEHCRWCPAKILCPAISEKALEQAKIEFAPINPKREIVLPDPHIPVAFLSRTLTAIDKLEVWIAAVKDHAFNELKRGVDVPGFKLVQKRALRKWIDEEETAKEAKKLWGKFVFTEPKLLSPAQLEKYTKDDKWVSDRVIAESSGLTLVADSDNRPAHNQIEIDFGKEVKENNKRKTLSKGEM